MKIENIQKIEDEINNRINLPKETKEIVKKEIFINIVIAIGFIIYFSAIIAVSLGKLKSEREIYFNIFSMLFLAIAITLFEIAYRKDSGKLAMYGIESLGSAMATLFYPFIIFELDEYHKKFFLIISGYISIYYLVKCIVIYVKIKKSYNKKISDVKEITKKIKKINYEDKESVIKKHKKEDITNNVNLEKVKTKNTKTKKDSMKENVEEEQKEEKIAKKRGIPKKEESIKVEVKEKIENEDAPKRRGRPKKTEEKIEKKVEEKTPKKRGRPRKVETK